MKSNVSDSPQYSVVSMRLRFKLTTTRAHCDRAENVNECGDAYFIPLHTKLQMAVL